MVAAPTIRELARKSGIKYNTIYKRLRVLKWEESIALSTPLTTPRAYKKILKKQKQ